MENIEILFVLWQNRCLMTMTALSFTKPYFPDQMDGAFILPENHRIIGKIRECRIVDVQIPPASVEKPHVHNVHSFTFVDSPTAISVRLVDEMRNTIEIFRREDTSASPEIPTACYVEPEPLHFAENLDANKTWRAIKIEVLSAVKPHNGHRSSLHKGILSLPNAIPNADVWSLEIEDHGISTIKTNDSEGVLVSKRGTALRIVEAVGGMFEDVIPLNITNAETSLRPSVWLLQPGKDYHFLNSTDHSEKIYLFELRA